MSDKPGTIYKVWTDQMAAYFRDKFTDAQSAIDFMNSLAVSHTHNRRVIRFTLDPETGEYVECYPEIAVRKAGE